MASIHVEVKAHCIIGSACERCNYSLSVYNNFDFDWSEQQQR